MIDVVGVRFKEAGKIYYFDPLEYDPKEGEAVIVETARGVEYGTIVIEKRQIPKEDLVKELKPIIRIATEDDKEQHRINLERKMQAIAVCEEKVKNHGLEMKLVDMEYTFDNNKVIFYFTADGRVDFRELVRDLASYFKVRIELRQIGVRDQTKQLGGIGSCGRVCCCKNHLGEFSPISITMAKNQGMSLNPTKISGLCGRLLCCLSYENSFYEEALDGMASFGDIVDTPSGTGTVIKQLPLSGEVKVIVNKGKFDESVVVFPKEKVVKTGKRDRDYVDPTEYIDDEDEKIDIKKLEE